MDAFVQALNEALGFQLRIGDYHEHALGVGSTATAVAYVELVFGTDQRLFGAGAAPSIVEATFSAVLSALARAVERGWLQAPKESEARRKA